MIIQHFSTKSTILQNEIMILSLCKQQNFSHLVFKGRAFNYFRKKDSVPSIYLFSRFYLKYPLEELTRENNDEKFHGLSIFLSQFPGSKSIPEKNKWLY